MTTTTLNISLTEQLKQKAQERVSTGDFSTPSDYIRHLIRQDITQNEEDQMLRFLLQEGIDSGVSPKSKKQIYSELREHIKTKTA